MQWNPPLLVAPGSLPGLTPLRCRTGTDHVHAGNGWAETARLVLLRLLRMPFPSLSA